MEPDPDSAGNSLAHLWANQSRKLGRTIDAYTVCMRSQWGQAGWGNLRLSNHHLTHEDLAMVLKITVRIQWIGENGS